MAHISLTSLQTTHISATSRTSESRVSKASAQDMQDALSEVRAAQLAQPAPEIEAVDSFSLIRPKGDPYHLYQKTPELLEQAKALAERLDGPIHDANDDHFFYQDSMRDFLQAGLLTDPDFLDLSESLSDEELGELAMTVSAMRLPASANYTIPNEADRSYQGKVAEFMDVLENSSLEDRAAILSRSAEYASKVDTEAVANFRKNVYSQTPNDIKFTPYPREISANPLHNYITAVLATDDPAALTEQLGQLPPDAEAGLLSVYGLDPSLGDRLSQLAGPDGQNLPDSLLSALGSMADKVKVSNFASDVDKQLGVAWHGDEALLKDNEQSQGRDFALDSVSSMIDMLETYNFSDEQLNTMGTELTSLSNPEKRAYIDITTLGLEDMLQSKVTESFDKKNLDEAIEVVSELRSNPKTLSLVNSTRYHDVTLIERPDIDEGLTVVALEGAAVFQGLETAVKQSRLLLGALSDNANMKNGHSVKGHESGNLYSAKTLDVYKQDVGNLVSTLVAFESMRGDSTASEKVSLNEFSDHLSDMHSGIRDETLSRVKQALDTNVIRDKATENTQFAFLSNLIQQMAFETKRDFKDEITSAMDDVV
ncbi:hypothetical protein [Marinomonas atlantica]|uniref:hypothetical protein n=1 Tax=Marinomonas atlantica TaxID=1806668 RepID=UPI0008374698|nr:hypothetical protein [Marinomonas atlantica]